MDWPRGHSPRRVAASNCGMRRATARSNASACSAMEMAETPGVLVTVMPWRAAAGRSTWSVPVPHTEMRRRRGHRAKTRSVNLEEAVFGAGEGVVVVELGARRQFGPDGAGAQDGGSVVGDGDSRH